MLEGFCARVFYFGSEAVKASGEAARGLVKSRVEFPPAQICGVFLIMRSPVHANFRLAEKTVACERRRISGCHWFRRK